MSSHRGAGVFDHSTRRTLYVDNDLHGTRKDFQVGSDVPTVPAPALGNGESS